MKFPVLQSPACIAKYKNCREHVDSLIREIEDIKYDGYVLRKSEKPLKEKLDAQTLDYKRVQKELSDKNCLYEIVKQKFLTVTAELNAANARFKNAEFNFKKFDVSSENVETMIENHLKFKNNSTDGLGYNAVPPPFNDNYTPPLEPVILKS